MKAIVLTLSCSLLAASLVGMARGPVATGARVEAEPDTTGITSIRLDHHDQPAEVQRADWLPEPHRGRVLAADETVRVIPLDVWRASLVISDANRYALLRACWCESRWRTDLVGAAGEIGACQVMPRFWGPVPPDLEGQFRQANAIVEQHGLAPWTTQHGCKGWSA